MNLREKILQNRPAKTEAVLCPEWDCSVNVKAISGTERDEYESSLSDDNGERSIANMRARLCVLACVDDDGKPLFTSDDAAALGKQPASALDRVFQVAKRLGGIGQEAVKDAEKNSESGPSVDSPSA